MCGFTEVKKINPISPQTPGGFGQNGAAFAYVYKCYLNDKCLQKYGLLWYAPQYCFCGIHIFCNFNPKFLFSIPQTITHLNHRVVIRFAVRLNAEIQSKSASTNDQFNNA